MSGTDRYGYRPTALDRAVDGAAIARENAAYLARPQAERDAEAEHYHDQTLWLLALRYGYGLAGRIDADNAEYAARLRAEREGSTR